MPMQSNVHACMHCAFAKQCWTSCKYTSMHFSLLCMRCIIIAFCCMNFSVAIFFSSTHCFAIFWAFIAMTALQMFLVRALHAVLSALFLWHGNDVLVCQVLPLIVCKHIFFFHRPVLADGQDIILAFCWAALKKSSCNVQSKVICYWGYLK